MRTLAILIVVLAAGCATAPGAPADNSAAQAFEHLEQNLLEAAVLRVNYTVQARGAVEAELSGDLVMQKPALAALSAEGSFAGGPVAPELVVDGARMRGRARPQQDGFEAAQPADLRNGMLLGLMRMGILHNIAMLSGNLPPDATSGNVRDWVIASNFAWQPGNRTIDGVPVRGIGFDLTVGGVASGTVVLWYDPASDLPVAREQRVGFEKGEMKVIERYAVETGGIIGPCRFDLDTIPPP